MGTNDLYVYPGYIGNLDMSPRKLKPTVPRSHLPGPLNVMGTVFNGNILLRHFIPHQCVPP